MTCNDRRIPEFYMWGRRRVGCSLQREYLRGDPRIVGDLRIVGDDPLNSALGMLTNGSRMDMREVFR